MPQRFGEFELGRRIGAGGMGVVFEARHALLDRRVALKFLRTDMVHLPHARARLLREAWALTLLDHPNIIQLFDVGTSDAHPFIAMELAEGGTLREWMQCPHDWRAVVDMFVELGHGLARVHALGLVHRDVNPSNVFLDASETPKLGDFGLVRSVRAPEREAHKPTADRIAIGDRSRTADDIVLGTPAYMPPEQCAAFPLDGRTDEYAFCVSLHEALAGELPSGGQVSSAVPRVLHAALLRGLAPKPDARFPSMSELLTALADARR